MRTELDEIVDGILVQLLSRGPEFALKAAVGLLAAIISATTEKYRTRSWADIEYALHDEVERYDGIVEQIREEHRRAPPSEPGLVKRVRIDPKGPRTVTLDALSEKLLSLALHTSVHEAGNAALGFCRRIEKLLKEAA